MAVTPKKTWTESDVLTTTGLNAIENNVEELGKTANTHANNISSLRTDVNACVTKAQINTLINQVTLWQGVGNGFEIALTEKALKNSDSNGVATLIVCVADDYSISMFTVGVTFSDGLETHIGYKAIDIRDKKIYYFSNGNNLYVTHKNNNMVKFESETGKIIDIKALINRGGKLV